MVAPKKENTLDCHVAKDRGGRKGWSTNLCRKVQRGDCVKRGPRADKYSCPEADACIGRSLTNRPRFCYSHDWGVGGGTGTVQNLCPVSGGEGDLVS